jgi:pimeloyl-ACP methyl ester carboxylesterase
VIAHDFGGAVSLRTHLTLGVPYASLMLVNPVAIPLIGSPFFRFVEEHPTVLTELPGFIHESVVGSYIRGGSHPGFTDAELAALAAPWLNETGQTALYHQIADFDVAYWRRSSAAARRSTFPFRSSGANWTTGSPPNTGDAWQS